MNQNIQCVTYHRKYVGRHPILQPRCPTFPLSTNSSSRVLTIEEINNTAQILEIASNAQIISYIFEVGGGPIQQL